MSPTLRFCGSKSMRDATLSPLTSPPANFCTVRFLSPVSGVWPLLERRRHRHALAQLGEIAE